MSGEDTIRKNGPAKGYNNERGGAAIIKEPTIGIVKSNVDPTHTGRIFVYFPNFGGNQPDNRDNWVPVRYMSPFMGTANADGGDSTGYGKFNGNPHSYGFWASAPDVGTEVVCIFINGRIDQGFYIGCVPKVGQIQMIPAIGSSDHIVPNNEEEAKTYSGSTRVPVVEANMSNPKISKSAQVYDEAKPIHSYQAAILAKQGLMGDSIRGTISSSAQRESPSQVFGFSTPGRPIFEGGYTSKTIANASKTATPEKLKITGRTGGHSFVMDDGTLDGQDQLLRLRTAGGHQIMMNDSGQALFIIHSNGLSWMEFGKEGTIDLYSKNSFNVRTQGDLNFHADNNVNIHANKNMNLYGSTVNIQSGGQMNLKAGGGMVGQSGSDTTFLSGGGLGFACASDGGFTAGGQIMLTGSKVGLNSGTAGPAPMPAGGISQSTLPDTAYGSSGWNPAAQLKSITTRAPTHQPYAGASKGAPVKSKVEPYKPNEATTATADAVNSNTPATPNTPVSEAAVASAPASAVEGAGLTKEGATALTAQAATNAQALSDEAKKAAGVVSSASGLTAKQLEAGGVVPPGAGSAISGLISRGMNAAKVLAHSLTGGGGATDAKSLIAQPSTQGGIMSNIMASASNALKKAGLLTGKESNGQSGGMIMAAATAGVKAVKNFFSGGAASAGQSASSGTSIAGVVGSIKDSIASGKLAGQIGDKLSTGMSSLTSSLKSFGSDLKSGAMKMFAAVEKSYEDLKLAVGQPNKLASAKKESATASAGASYDAAKAEYDAAEEEWLKARLDFRNTNSAADKQRVIVAEAKMAAANQKIAQASSSFLANATGGLSTAVSNSANSVLAKLTGGSTGGTSIVASATNLFNKAKAGLSSIPGGLSGMFASSGTQAKGSITSLPSGQDLLDGASKLAGNLVDGTKKAVNNLVAKAEGAYNTASSAITDIFSGGGTSSISADGIMASVSAGLDSIGGLFGNKSGPQPANVINTAALDAKVGSLIGDPKVPTPTFGDIAEYDTTIADQIAQNQANSLVDVQDALALANAAEIKLENLLGQYGDSAGGEALIEKARLELAQARINLAVAESKYSNLTA